MPHAYLRTLFAGLVAVALAVAGPVPAASSASGQPGDDRSQAPAATACANLKNRTGITDRTITIANVSDLTGPFPDLSRSATQAVRAYVRYFNQSSAICGRKLRLLALDSRTDPAVERTRTITACRQAFVAVGSSSIVDQGGAARAQLCGLPDLRAQFSSPQRHRCSTCFATEVDEPGTYENAVADFFLARNPVAAQRAGAVALDVAPWNVPTVVQAQAQRGLTFQYVGRPALAEFDYGPYVANLKNHHVSMVEALGPPTFATRLALAMKAAALSPTVFLLDPDLYHRVDDPAFEGAIVPVNHVPFEQGGNAELARYRYWLNKVAPGARPTSTGLFAWSAARLFTQQARALGGRLNRPNLITALSGVQRWRGLGLHVGQDVGGKANGNCWRFLKRSGSRWVAIGGTSYRCTGKTVVTG